MAGRYSRHNAVEKLMMGDNDDDEVLGSEKG